MDLRPKADQASRAMTSRAELVRSPSEPSLTKRFRTQRAAHSRWAWNVASDDVFRGGPMRSSGGGGASVVVSTCDRLLGCRDVGESASHVIT